MVDLRDLFIYMFNTPLMRNKDIKNSKKRIQYLKDFHTGPAYISYPDDADGRASRWAAELWREVNGK